MVFALLNSSMKKIDIHLEAEMAIDAFVGQYGVETILNWEGDTTVFKPFVDILHSTIHGFLIGT